MTIRLPRNLSDKDSKRWWRAITRKGINEMKSAKCKQRSACTIGLEKPSKHRDSQRFRLKEAS